MDRPDALISSSQDVMHLLMHAPCGIGLLSTEDYRKAAKKFPGEGYLSDERSSVGTGQDERVSLNLKLQIRFITKRSIAPYVHLQHFVDSNKKEMTQSGAPENVGPIAGTSDLNATRVLPGIGQSIIFITYLFIYLCVCVSV